MATKQFKSKVGNLSWVIIDGAGKDNYNRDGKVFTASVSFEPDSPECEEMMAKIDSFWEDNKPNRRATPKSIGYKKEQTKDADGDYVDTGNIVFTFTTNTTFPDGHKQVVQILNSAGRPISLRGKKIGNGSVGVLHGTLGMYNAKSESGVSIYLRAVQLAKLVEHMGVQADAIEGDESIGCDEVDDPTGRESYDRDRENYERDRENYARERDRERDYESAGDTACKQVFDAGSSVGD